MANATADRNTIKFAPTAYFPQYTALAAAAAEYYVGTMQMIDITDDSAANPTGAADMVWGVVKMRLSNTGALGDKLVELESGVFVFANSGSNTIVAADRGKIAYAEDNQTVGSLITAMTPAGIILDMHADGVVVGIGPMFWSGQ